MKAELETLVKKASEKSLILKEKRGSLEELPKIVREIEAHIRKGYSLFFDTQVHSKKQLTAIATAPPKLQIAFDRFNTACETSPMRKHLSLTVDSIDADYKPLKAGLIYPYTFTLQIDMKGILESKVIAACQIIEMDGLRQLLTPLTLTVRIVVIVDWTSYQY